ncbi:MAG: Fur family transcriptional regulator [Pseudomonadota bacterium]
MARVKDPGEKSPSSIQAEVQAAVALCRQRGGHVTPLREAVLTALLSARGPIGAYDLKERVSDAVGRPISPASIYRALDFLIAQGVAARIESRNAFVASEHPGHDHTCILFVCDACGSSSEIENETLERLLAADARELGFSIDHRVIELSGACAECRTPAK